MKTSMLKSLVLLFVFNWVGAQENQKAKILGVILETHYKTEKPIYKGRNQLLFLYCEKPNNNEEIFQTVNEMKLPLDQLRAIKQQVFADTDPETWAGELDEVLKGNTTNLDIKVNACLSLDQYHEKRKKLNLNNQRLMIVSKPVIYSNGTLALVKVVFYRTIEHNNGSILLMEKTANGWVIKDSLNSWST